MNGLAFDWTVNLGHVLTILGFLGGGYAFVLALQNKLDALAERVVKTETQLVRLVEVLIAQGVHEARMDALDQRFNLHGERLDKAVHRFDAYIDRQNN